MIHMEAANQLNTLFGLVRLQTEMVSASWFWTLFTNTNRTSADRTNLFTVKKKQSRTHEHCDPEKKKG